MQGRETEVEQCEIIHVNNFMQHMQENQTQKELKDFQLKVTYSDKSAKL